MTRLKLGLITFMCFVCFSAMLLFSACATQGEKGDKGETGNGIFSIAKVSTDGLTDTYKITYTDGNFTTFCVTNGQVGQNGIGIEDVEINSEGELVIVFTDDNSINLGKVIGKDGVGIQSASVDVDGNLSIVLTDEKIINLGNIKGEDGVSITKTEIDENGNLLITFSDRQEPVNLGKVVGADGQDGTVWLVGADVPDNALGKDGDLYLDSITKILYRKNGNEWEEQFSLVDERKSFTLTFDEAGGEMQEPKSLVVKEGEYVQLPVPTKDEYIFIGWYNGTDANAGQVTNTTPIFTDMVLTARWRADFSEGLRYSLNADGLSYTCTGIGNYFGNKIKFPSLYNGLPITAIAENAFVQNGFINEVVISSSITTIGESAFLSCRNLEKVTFDEGSKLQVIEETAFNGCGALSEIKIPSSVVTIGGYVFAGCDKLQTVIFAEDGKLQTIGNNAFAYRTSISEITIPSSVVTISGGAFAGCEDLRTVTFAEGSKLQTIGDNAFGDCSSLTGIIIPSSVVTIGGAFENCTSLTEMTIPSEVTTIGRNIFAGCVNLRMVTFAEGSKLQTIENNAFENCTSLTEITIPSEVTTIGSDIFRGCTNLQTIILPAGLEKIDLTYDAINAFVFYLGDSQSWSQIDGGNYFASNVYFYSESQPEDDGNYWRYVNGKPIAWSWGDIKTFKFITNNGTQIPDITGYVLYELPDPVSTGKIFAGWYDNEELSGTPVTTPYYNSEKTTLYAAWVEQGQQSEGLEIKNGVIVGIGTCKDTVLKIAMPVADRAFSNCSQITEVYFYDGCIKLGNDAFENCSKLKKVYFYQSFLPEIGSDLFSSTWDDKDFRVYVPADLITQYQNVKDTYWQRSIIKANKLETFSAT